jgi:tetratricopeptide (TPR) repeat protein
MCPKVAVGQASGIPAGAPASRQVCTAAIALALACWCLAGTRAAAAGRAWHKAQSQNFTLVGSAEERDLRRAAQDLEALHATLSSIYPGLEPTVPTWVVIFKDMREFTRFLPRDDRGRPRPNVGGYFLPDPDVNYIVFGDYRSEYGRRVVLHEYAHSALHRGARKPPMWLNEGLADFYSTFEWNPKVAPTILGRPPADLLGVLRSQEFIPLERIIAAKNTDALWEDGARVAMFYAESWALVHYLAVERKRASTGQIAAYLAALDRATAPAQAFEEAFGESIAEVDVKLRTYVRRPEYEGLAVTPGTVPTTSPVVVPMSGAEVGWLQGDLLLRVGTLDEADAELSAALALDPSNVDGRIAVARVDLVSGRREHGVAALREIAAANPLSFAAQYYLGGALGAGRQYYDAFAAYDNAVLLREDSSPALFAFSTVALALGLDDAAEASLDRAMQIEFNPVSYRDRAYSAFGFGRDTAAAADAERYIKAVGLHDPSAQTVAIVGAIACRRARRPAEAEALLDRVRAVAPPSSWNAVVVEFLQGRIGEDRLLARASDQAKKTAAHTYIGLKDAVEGRTSNALEHFRWVRDEGAKEEIDYGIAIEELIRFETPERKY